MPNRLYDHEFSAGVLQMLRKREALGQSNTVHFVPLVYNLRTEAECGMEERFSAERRSNPLLETTHPVAWLAAEFFEHISEIRPNVEFDEFAVVAALKRYFQRAVLSTMNEYPGEEQLWTTVRPYRDAMKKLLLDLFNRRQSLRSILKLPAGSCTIHQAMSEREPSSRREEVILRGIKEHWSSQRIARELDNLGWKPRSASFKSYSELLHMNPQNFYSLKSAVKRKYLIT